MGIHESVLITPCIDALILDYIDALLLGAGGGCSTTTFFPLVIVGTRFFTAVYARHLRQLSRIQAAGEECSRMPPLTLACAMPGSSKGREDGERVGEGAKENVEQTDGTHVAALKDEVQYIRVLLLIYESDVDIC